MAQALPLKNFYSAHRASLLEPAGDNDCVGAHPYTNAEVRSVGNFIRPERGKVAHLG
jgi:hypothetical protein